jgi:hypothetical protein
MEKHYYVYYSYEEWGRGYIGRRECVCLPEEDTKYFGSFTDKSFKPLNKIILATFNSREEMCQAEVELHNFFEVDKNPHFANKARQTSSKFYMDKTGENNPNFGNRWSHTEEWKKARSEAYLGEGNPNYGNRWEWDGERKESWQGEKNPAFGKPSRNLGHIWKLTDEQKENRRQAALARPAIECSICGRLCKGQAGLINHMRKHRDF